MRFGSVFLVRYERFLLTDIDTDAAAAAAAAAASATSAVVSADA